MTNCIDLHIHSNKSDGSFSSKEIVEMAYKKRLRAIAITDHDTIDGYIDAAYIAEQVGLEIIPGIEINTDFEERQLHILGYFIDINSEYLQKYCKAIKENKAEILIWWFSKLRKMGIRISLQEMKEKKLGLNEEGIISLLIAKEYVKNRRQAKEIFFNPGGELYVKRDKPKPEEAIDVINKANGISIIAHPLRSIKYSNLEELIYILKKQGLKGIECFHPEQDEAMLERCVALANKYSLYVTGGSDFHGDLKPDICLGQGNVPYKLLEKMKGEKNGS